jgi:hypothetical protein
MEMPPQVEEAYRIWLDPAGRNVYEVARVLGGRRQTYQDWSVKWRWRERAEVEDLEGRDRAVRMAYHKLQEAAASFTETTILAARCRVDANGVHYAIDNTGKRVDCPSPVATKAAATGLATLGISPVKAMAIQVSAQGVVGVTDDELDAMLASGDTAGLLALASGKLPPRTVDPPDPEISPAHDVDFQVMATPNGAAANGSTSK